MTQLNKQFSERDVQRMRNIISGNTADNTRIQTGYSNKKIQHTEGDIWEENGKTWTIHNGIKQTVTRHDALKAMVEFPLTCPECNKPMKNHTLNKKMYNIHKMCSDCVIEMETKLKIEGKYNEYEKKLLNANKNTSANDAEQMFEDFINNPTSTYITEDGIIENWIGGEISPELIKTVKDNIKRLRETEI
jgi:polyribonucleotide nucleotidyltransferase